MPLKIIIIWGYFIIITNSLILAEFRY